MQIEIDDMKVEIGEPGADHASELIDGKHTAVYIDMGTFDQRMVRLENALDAPPSKILLELMPERHKEGQVSIQLACKPCGFYMDSAPTFEDAKIRARELIAYNDDHHKRAGDGH